MRVAIFLQNLKRHHYCAGATIQYHIVLTTRRPNVEGDLDSATKPNNAAVRKGFLIVAEPPPAHSGTLPG
jgi:hypothetical protein